METIEVKITIPKTEYKEWSEFYEGGVNEVKKSIVKDLSDRIKKDGVKSFTIEAYHNASS